jgi:reverse gyrase
MWAKRVLRGESFAATAPTGVGKTSFGIAISLFLALKGKRCYIIFPTSLLVSQAAQILEEYGRRAGVEVSLNLKNTGIKAGCYHGRMGKKEKESLIILLVQPIIMVRLLEVLICQKG